MTAKYFFKEYSYIEHFDKSNPFFAQSTLKELLELCTT